MTTLYCPVCSSGRINRDPDQWLVRPADTSTLDSDDPGVVVLREHECDTCGCKFWLQENEHDEKELTLESKEEPV